MSQKILDHYQVTIVGAGPAGCSAAIHFKRKNKQVLLIDKSHFPRDKVCGDGIPLKTFNLLKELDFDESELFTKGFKINQMNVYSPSNNITEFGNLKRDTSTKSGCIPRLDFDNALFNKAASVVDTVLTGYKVVDTNYNDGIRNLKLQNVDSRNTVTVSTDLVIAADGAHSIVARQTGLLKRDDAHHFDGLRLYYNGGNFDPVVHLFYDKRTLPGYVWIFPVSGQRANVGIMIDQKHKKLYGKTIKDIFFEVINSNPKIKQILLDAKPEDKVRGASLPLGTLPGSRIDNNLMLIGDAAAFINPLTGGGIYYGILSAKMAAIFGSESIDRGNVTKKGLEKYERWWRNEILPGFIYANRLKKLFSSEKITGWYLDMCSKNGAFATFFISVYGRLLSKYFILNPKFWYRIFTKNKYI